MIVTKYTIHNQLERGNSITATDNEMYTVLKFHHRQKKHVFMELPLDREALGELIKELITYIV